MFWPAFVIFFLFATEDPFLSGVSAFNEQKYEQARDHFLLSLTQNPDNPTVLSNLGLTFHKLEKFGLAIGYFRRSIELEGLKPVSRDGLRLSIDKLKIKEIPHRRLIWEDLRDTALVPASLHLFIGMFALITLFWGWMILSYVGYRRRSLFAEQTPSAPSAALFFMGFLWLVLLGLSAMKVYDSTVPRATITAAEVPVFSAPTDEAVKLFTLHEGFEITLGRVQEDWVQVTYPGGLSGWASKKDLFITTGHSPW